ncbi:MAG: HEAT repeat domain-containing protein [Myxococcota bacterium]
MRRTITDMLSNEDESLAMRLDAISVLDERSCVRLLDWFPADTRLGRYLREVLVTEGAVVDALCVILWEGQGLFRLAAAQRLTELGDPDALPELIALLNRQLNGRAQPGMVLTLIKAIYACWMPGAVAAPRAVVEALTSHSPTVRRAAGTTLRRMGRDASVVGARLVELLDHDDEQVRFEAAELLPELTPPSVYVPHMARLLREDPDLLVRWIANDGLDHHTDQLPAA